MNKCRYTQRFLQSVCHLLIKWWRQPESWNLGFWSQCHLLIKRLRHPNLIKKSVSLLTQSGDTLIKRQIHPNLGFCSQCVTCWSNGGDNSPSWKLELRFLKSLSLADQKMETTHQWKLELRFLKSVSHSDQKVETPWSKSWDNPKVETPWSKGVDTQT